MLNSSIWLIDRTLSDATTPRQSGPGNDDYGEVLRIPQSSSMTAASPSDYLVSYILDTRWAYMESVYSTAPADWAGERDRKIDRQKERDRHRDRKSIRNFKPQDFSKQDVVI